MTREVRSQFVDTVETRGSRDRATARGGFERATERGTDRREERRLERPSSSLLGQDGIYSLDEERVPPGMRMEWKRMTLMGMNDRRNQSVIRQFHWEPVPHKMQPHILGHTCSNEDEHIVVGGLGLFMRPDYLCEEAEQEAAQNTDYQTSQQLNSLRLSSKEQVGDRYTKIKKSVVAVPQSVD